MLTTEGDSCHILGERRKKSFLSIGRLENYEFYAAITQKNQPRKRPVRYMENKQTNNFSSRVDLPTMCFSIVIILVNTFRCNNNLTSRAIVLNKDLNFEIYQLPQVLKCFIHE